MSFLIENKDYRILKFRHGYAVYYYKVKSKTVNLFIFKEQFNSIERRRDTLILN